MKAASGGLLTLFDVGYQELVASKRETSCFSRRNTPQALSFCASLGFALVQPAQNALSP
jgi:hypothetical protein